MPRTNLRGDRYIVGCSNPSCCNVLLIRKIMYNYLKTKSLYCKFCSNTHNFKDNTIE